ncbi:MAG: polyprenyl diphosphate synthase [Clostridia bacterium]|nr:polyprenyl diphosphate synthase [Clostridia bacterium]
MSNVINHLGIIMDGNRRWARKHAFSSVLEGHNRGANRIIDVCEWCIEVGVKNLSVYAFSTENFKRSSYEVDGIFKILGEFFARELDHCLRDGVRIYIIGNRSLLSEESLDVINKAEKATENCTNLNLFIALGYGGRDEIVRGVKALGQDLLDGKLTLGEIDEIVFQNYMDSKIMPDIDMVIRTGGNKRLSNYFPWLSVYSELYFIDTLWPDFSREDFDTALKYYEDVQINLGK